MYDSDTSYREQRRYYRDMRRYHRYRNPLRGLATGLFLIALIIGIAFSGIGFLPMLFVGLAFLSLFGSASSLNRHGIYGGLNGFIWMLGLALCFWIGFWPWILLPVAVTMILGSLYRPMMAGLSGAGFIPASQMQQQPYQQTVNAQSYPPQEQPGYQEGYQGAAYQQPGYQGAPQQPPAAYQEGGQQPAYHQEPRQHYEQPQVQYPEQELPPMQQG